MDSCLERLRQSGVARQLKVLFQSGTVDTESVCKKFAAEWNATLTEFSIVPFINSFFIDEMILEVQK